MSADLDESVREAIKDAFAGITPLIRYNAAINAINEATALVLAIPGLRQAWEQHQAIEGSLPMTKGRVWTGDGITHHTASELYSHLRTLGVSKEPT